MGFPEPDPLPGDDRDMPYFIRDDTFPLRTCLMKPFSHYKLEREERIFNYRLSRARRIVENTFGILANRFMCLLMTLQQEPETVGCIVLSCCCLHNLMRMRYSAFQNAALDQEDDNHQLIPGAWRDQANLQDMDTLAGGNTTTRAAKRQIQYNSPAGAVGWQNNVI